MKHGHLVCHMWQYFDKETNLVFPFFPILISVKEKLKEDADCEIATTELRVSLMCPLGKMRMSTPCR